MSFITQLTYFSQELYRYFLSGILSILMRLVVTRKFARTANNSHTSSIVAIERKEKGQKFAL